MISKDEQNTKMNNCLQIYRQGDRLTGKSTSSPFWVRGVNTKRFPTLSANTVNPYMPYSFTRDGRPRLDRFLSFPLVNLRSVNFNRSVNPLHKRPTREEADRACVMYQLLNLAFGFELDSPVKMKNRKLINRL